MFAPGSTRTTTLSVNKTANEFNMISVHALYEDCTGNDRQVAVGEEGDLNDGAP